MRRPNLCSNSIAVADETYKPTNASLAKDEGKLSIVRRVLGGSRKKDGHCSSNKLKQFGTPISELQLNNNNIPKVVSRICSYIEAHGLKTEGLFKLNGGNHGLIENWKSQFNANADADLETCNDVVSVGLLLMIWLKELPHPLLTTQAIADLTSLMHKYEGDTWWGPVCHETLLTTGNLSAATMQTIFHLLHVYTDKNPSSASYVPEVFAPLLTSENGTDIPSVETVELIRKLIKDYNVIFFKRNIEVDCLNRKQLSIVISDPRSSLKGKKKRDKHDPCLKLDRSFVRSNSEERPINNGSSNGNVRGESMRRVSSHEDFSKTPSNMNKQPAPIQLKKTAQPLHERNSCSPQRHLQDERLNSSPIVGYASDLYDENEHERRRNSERFAPQHGATRRNGGRRHRNKHSSSVKAKENAVYKPNKHEGTPREEISPEQKPSTPTKIVAPPAADPQSNPEPPQDSTSEERSPSPISGVGSPTLDLNTLYHGKLVEDDHPVPSFQWNNTIPAPSEERMVSPRNSLVATRRTYTAVHESFGEEPSVMDLATQINNLKRKLKKYDEGFEREFGYKPSHADKLANPDTKKMSAMLSKLKKQLRTTKERCSKLASESRGLKAEVIQEIEKRLSEKRRTAGRGETLEVMTHDQLVDEKAAMQKALLQLEASFGRPTSREERDMVHGLYDRYRLVKRMLLRHAPSKVKENISELGTILEHEAMEFSSSPPPSPTNGASSYLPTVPDVPERKTPELVLDNLHSLPRNELLEMQKSAREEKKRLRKSLKDFELEFQVKTGRKMQKEDRNPTDSTYLEYKQAKAKLRFIEALIMKHK